MGKYISTIIITLLFSVIFILYGSAFLLPLLDEGLKFLAFFILLPFIA